MNKTNILNQKEIDKIQRKIYQSKEEHRRIFAKEPFEIKIKVAFELYKQAEQLKNLDATLTNNQHRFSRFYVNEVSRF